MAVLHLFLTTPFALPKEDGAIALGCHSLRNVILRKVTSPLGLGDFAHPDMGDIVFDMAFPFRHKAMLTIEAL